jgi:branched-chain amino acid transport system substrate-binding protein
LGIKMKKIMSVLTLAGLCFTPPLLADIKIGFSGTLSGPAAGLGQDQLDGFRLALEQKNQKLGGQKTDLIFRDDRLKPQLGTQIVREFIDKERVDAIVGLGFSNVLMANLRRLTSTGTIALATNAGPSPMAGKLCSPNVFSMAWQNDGGAEAMGEMATSEGHKRVYLMAPNYQAGKDMLKGFKRFYSGEIINEVYTQVGQADYSAELTHLSASDADALFVFYPGGMGINFTKQLKQAGLLNKIPFYSVFTIDGTTLPALRNTAIGAVTGAMWSPALTNEANKNFVTAYTKRYDRAPSMYAAVGFDTANILDAAITSLEGDVSDKKAFAKAIHNSGSKFTSVRGPFKFNHNNLPIQNFYAFKTESGSDGIDLSLTTTPLPNHSDAYSAQCEVLND